MLVPPTNDSLSIISLPSICCSAGSHKNAKLSKILEIRVSRKSIRLHSFNVDPHHLQVIFQKEYNFFTSALHVTVTSIRIPLECSLMKTKRHRLNVDYALFLLLCLFLIIMHTMIILRLKFVEQYSQNIPSVKFKSSPKKLCL